MAEQIDRGAELLAVTNIALKHSVALHNTVNRYKNLPKPVCDLRAELEDLIEVFEILRDTINTNKSAGLTALIIPLQRCGEVCREFEELIIQYTNEICDEEMSLQGWAKLRYLGEDIYGFCHMVAGYKSTIKIALADVKL